MNIGGYATRWSWQPRFDTEKNISFDKSRAVYILVAAHILSLAIMALAQVLPSVFTVPFIVLSLSFIPGSLFLLMINPDRLIISAERVLYSFGSSLILLMIMGVLVNVLLPQVGIPRPLTPIPLGAGVTLLVVLLAVGARLRDPHGTVFLRVPPILNLTPLALLQIPLLVIVGVNILNMTGINIPILLILLLISMIPIIGIRNISDRWYPLAVWTVSVAILYHKSLWQYAGFGGRPHGIQAWEARRWTPGIVTSEPFTSELIQNGVLFPLYARLTDLFIITQYEVVNPFFVSFIPLALYVAFRQHVDVDMAFLGAIVFAFVHPFYYQYPTAGRAATPVIFLALFSVTLSHEGMPSTSRSILAIFFLTGVVVSHYGTSYYVAAGFFVALALLYALSTIDKLAGEHLGHLLPSRNGEPSIVRMKGSGQISTIFSPALVFLFFTEAIGWYFYARGGWKFGLLPKHIYRNILELIGGPTVSGRTAARVQENYTSLSIQFSKYIYILLAVSILIGLTVVYFRRIIARERLFNDQYLTIATALFMIFGTTIILRNWGGGRPMMITFSFTTVFAVIGIVSFVGMIKWVLAVFWQIISETSIINNPSDQSFDPHTIGAHVFAVALLILFLLNTGVGAAVVFGDFAPSNVPNQANLEANQDPDSQVTIHRQTDIATHLWMVRHGDSKYGIYTDTFGARQFDWYRPDIAARTPSVEGGYEAGRKPIVFDADKQKTGTQPGYILALGHNLALDAAWPSRFGSSVNLATLSLKERNLIYTNGESNIYFYNDTRVSPSDNISYSSNSD